MVLSNRSRKILVIAIVCYVCLQYIEFHHFVLESKAFKSLTLWVSDTVDDSLVMVCDKHGIPSSILTSSLPSIQQPIFLDVPISRIIHQSWKSHVLPKDFNQWSKSWKEHNIGWKFKLWDNDENRRLTAEHFSWFLSTYDSFKFDIMRADAARYMYLYQYGGVYADLDTWCMRSMNNITQLFGDSGVILAMISGDKDFEHDIPNAWMMSSPYHPFWIFLLRVIQSEWTKLLAAEIAGEQFQLEGITGPVVLKKAVKVWRCLTGRKAPITVVPPGYIFLQDWRNEEAYRDGISHCNKNELHTTDCLAAYPNGHVLTFWTHTWG